MSAEIAIPALTGIAGVIIGALLTPWFSDHYKRKQKTFRVNVFDQNPKTLISDQSNIKILWDDEEFDSVVQIGFEIINISKSTHRNFIIEIEAGEFPHTENDIFDISFNVNEKIRFNEVDCSRKLPNGEAEAASYKFDLFEKGALLSGNIITNGTKIVRFLTPDQFELDVRLGSRGQLRGALKEIGLLLVGSLPLGHVAVREIGRKE